ncbi:MULTISPECIES: DUF4296 domain-containing protein [Amniculibacterium]|uniref:DUF4296 domain-containing protein n=1 Tax=Amniculibacterium TaxID=2715289 RepID=UPI000F5B1E78|nr:MULTISPECIES: DUF4296 domain-containing protein [Amniculibacterium]
MKNWALLLVFTSIFSCNSILEKPKNLISKDEMTQLLVEMALNDQTNYINPSGNMENGVRYILQKHKIKGKDFTDSYEYYILNNDIQDIYQDAQDIILEKDPKSKKYILEAMERNKNITTQKQTLQ